MKDNVYALVEESVGHYWDQVANGNIPGCLVAVTMVWTKVNHVDIGKWYQGIAEMNTPNSSGASRTKKKGSHHAANAQDLVEGLENDLIFN